MKRMLIMAAACLIVAMTFAVQCTARTKKGTQCKRQVLPGKINAVRVEVLLPFTTREK